MNGENFWNDQKKAQAIIRETNNLKSLLDNHHKLKEALEELSSSLDELKERNLEITSEFYSLCTNVYF